jgi:hypothetical protein
MRVLSAGITRAHALGSLREVKFPPYWLRRQPHGHGFVRHLQGS